MDGSNEYARREQRYTAMFSKRRSFWIKVQDDGRVRKAKRLSRPFRHGDEGSEVEMFAVSISLALSL
jgi:hypothetical protein